MGLEVLDEFRPIMPIRTVPTARIFSQRAELPDLEIRKEEEEEECHTPTSPSQTLRTPLVCPPAPKKPRVARRTNLTAPSRRFFQVPHDLASVFLLHAKPSPSGLPTTSQEERC